MTRHKNNNTPGLASYLVVAALVTIAGLFGWISERDYRHEREMEWRAHVDRAEVVIEMTAPVDLEWIES